MKGVRDQIRSIILESISEPFFVHYDEESDDFDSDQVWQQAFDVAKSSGVNILSDMELSGVLLKDDRVVGCLWIGGGRESFSFDIAIDPLYRNKGLSHVLIKNALSAYEERNEAFEQMEGHSLPMKVDVINPVLASTLISKYGFVVSQRLTKDRAILERP
jgi:hypothetical protein